jgi:TonB family protein
MAAFTVAVAVHLSAVVVASLRHETATVNPGGEFATIDLVPDVQSAAPSETEIPQQMQSVSPEEFVESQPQPYPNPKKQPILPLRAARQTPVGLTPSPRASVLSAPRPEYPYEARTRHITGSGVAVLTVDPATGLVGDVMMEQSIGRPILDNSAISAFRRWRFKPGNAPKVRVPIIFNLTGAQY